jgi:rhomboid protease GluP
MFRRQTTGSVICISCGYLVGVRDEKCYHCGRRNPGLWGWAPALRSLGQDLGFVPFVTGLCVVLYGLMVLLSGPAALGGGFNFLSPAPGITRLFGASGAVPVMLEGHWWTVLSAGWLHANILHILFNMMWVRQLAPAVGEHYGPGRMVIIYTVASVVGFATTSIAGWYLAFMPGPFRGAVLTVGASAPIFGLLGALVYYGQRAGSSMTREVAWNYAVVMFIFGFIMPGIDNYAHAGGFAGGYLAGKWLDPLKPERVHHMGWALVCLGLSIVSILLTIAVNLG